MNTSNGESTTMKHDTHTSSSAEEEKKEDVGCTLREKSSALTPTQTEVIEIVDSDNDDTPETTPIVPDAVPSIPTASNSPPKSTTASKKSSSSLVVMWSSSCLKLSLSPLMFLLALALAASYCLSEIHDHYFVTMMERARRTDQDLMEEYTYYNRPCSVVDVTATPQQAAQELWYSERAVDQMMLHGAIMIPDLLQPKTVSELRKFVLRKNAAVKGTPAEYPVSQGSKRISYGIEAAEDPIVVQALKELYDNQDLKSLLEGLVGKNPSLTEITAITASYGCPDQAWHSDVKSDGNGVQFGRTYSHSYSLFMMLQNTTGKMGATDLCPGTHYCADDLVGVCQDRKVGLHQMRPEKIFKAGDGALLNQQVWHRGTKHTDPNASERILFIVSFVGRPNDPRQLSRGTYFHMKWNMW